MTSDSKTYSLNVARGGQNDWAALNGKDRVTVSSLGIANGVGLNGGADFGPDTPGTVTSGIQEAINFIGGGAARISLLGGTYKFAGPKPSASLGANFTFLQLPASSADYIQIEIEGTLGMWGKTTSQTGTVLDLTALGSPSTNNSWYAIGPTGASTNQLLWLVLRNLSIWTPTDVGFVYNRAGTGTVLENVSGIAGNGGSIATKSNCVGYDVDGYANNLSWLNNVGCQFVYNGFYVVRDWFNAGNLFISNCQRGLALAPLNASIGGLGGCIQRYSAYNNGDAIYVYSSSPNSNFQMNIFEFTNFLTTYNANIAFTNDINDGSNLLSAHIYSAQNISQSAGGGAYTWNALTLNGGAYVLVDHVLGSTADKARIGASPPNGIDSRTGLSSADGSPVVLVATPSAGGLYDLGASADITTILTAAGTYTLTYTDINATPHTIVPMNAQTAVGHYTATPVDATWVKGATNVTVQATGAFGTTSRLNVYAYARQVA